jgi:hypothetical protein
MKRTAITRPKPQPGILRTASLKAGKPTLAAKPRMRKCAICRTPFAARSMTHKACSESCAAAVAKQVREKAERKELREKKLAIKPRKWWLAKAKTALHAYIRARDEGKTCISCETILIKLGRVGGDYDAGHFRSVGSAKHLEFAENNIHGQCKHCNDYLGGNPAGYERGLLERFGPEYVEALKSDNEPRHLTIDDFKAIEAYYKAALKRLAMDKGVE